MSKNIKISIVLIILFMVAVLSLFINKLTTPRYLSAPELLVNGYYQFPSPKEFSNFQILTSNDIALDKDIYQGKVDFNILSDIHVVLQSALLQCL
jgi:protein SCO1/2